MTYNVYSCPGEFIYRFVRIYLSHCISGKYRSGTAKVDIRLLKQQVRLIDYDTYPKSSPFCFVFGKGLIGGIYEVYLPIHLSRFFLPSFTK